MNKNKLIQVFDEIIKMERERQKSIERKALIKRALIILVIFGIISILILVSSSEEIWTTIGSILLIGLSIYYLVRRYQGDIEVID